MSAFNDHTKQIQKLENELDEMTLALSHAWDQLVPFLQDIPETTQANQDITPTLQAIAVAADCKIVGIYLFEEDCWYTYPDYAEPTDELLADLKAIDTDSVAEYQLKHGERVIVASTPIISEGKVIGVLGVASPDTTRTFTAVDFQILHRMAERFGSQIAVSQLALLREREALQARELQIANDIQQSVLPTRFPQNKQITMAAFWQPAKEVGGDAWGWIQQDESHLAWFVLDVAGKGLPAALAAVALHTAISMALRMNLNPLQVLEVINEQFYDAYTRTDLMATVAIISLDVMAGHLEIANAGHPPLLVRHKRQWSQLRATAPPIGVLPDLLAETQQATLLKDDLVIIYSDGFSEIERANGELWGAEGILKAIPHGACDVAKLTRHITVASQYAGKKTDDQTLISLIYQDGR